MKLRTKTPITFVDPVYNKTHKGVWMDSYQSRDVEYNSVIADDLPSSINSFSVPDSAILSVDEPAATAARSVNNEARLRQLQKSKDHYDAQILELSSSADLTDPKVGKALAKLQKMSALRESQIKALL